MEKLLTGRRIIVTGGSRGLGFAIASALAVDGAQVMLVARTKDHLEGASARIREMGGIATHHAADVCEAKSAESIVHYALEEFGGVDGLVNNAGVFIWKKFVELPADDFDRTIATNLSAAFYLSQSVVKTMIKQGEGGSIVNIASIHGKLPDPNVVAHCASKSGLIGLTQAMADAVREHDIRVNAICPGAIQPDSSERRSATPREKVTQADIATLTVYLSSDLSHAITGAAIDVYGSTHRAIKV